MWRKRLRPCGEAATAARCTAGLADPFALGDGPDACLLLHGLTGSPAEMRPVGDALAAAGFRAVAPLLPGHGTTPESLIGVTAEDWIDAVVAKYREVRVLHPRLHIMGMCMGALLSAVLAQRERHAQGNLILLAPPVYIDD